MSSRCSPTLITDQTVIICVFTEHLQDYARCRGCIWGVKAVVRRTPPDSARIAEPLNNP